MSVVATFFTICPMKGSWVLINQNKLFGFFWILGHLPLSWSLFQSYPWRFWVFWSETLGQRPLEASLTISLDWKSVRNTSKWCLADSWVVFWSFETFLLWQILFSIYIWAILRFWGGNTQKEVRWALKLISSCVKDQARPFSSKVLPKHVWRWSKRFSFTG